MLTFDWLILIVVLGLVTYRVTRFLIADTLIAQPRRKLLDWIAPQVGPMPPKWRIKIWELLTCPYCLSIWVAGGAVGLTAIWRDIPMPVWTWLATAGMCMAWYAFIEDD